MCQFGSYITSYARRQTILTSQKIKDYSIEKYGIDKYIYSDTDSIHTTLGLEDLEKIVDIDDCILGKWKHESSFEKAKFIRQKCYVEIINNEYNIVCSGLPKKCVYKKPEDEENVYYKTYNEKFEIIEKKFSLKDFKIGFIACGKLTYKYVKGGCILVDTDFSIKEQKLLLNKGK